MFSLEEYKKRRAKWIRENGVLVGYSKNLDFMERWEYFGLLCAYEHCILNMPLAKNAPWACPLYDRWV